MSASNDSAKSPSLANELEDAMESLRSMFGPSFSVDMAVIAFDRIARECFARNFGSMGKQNMDVLLFDVYRKALYEGYKLTGNDKGFVNSKSYSDYSISRALGLTETRVRAFKEKALILYGDVEGDNCWWYRPLLADLTRSEPVGARQYKFKITDKCVRDELENYLDNELEEQGNFIEYSFNPKVVTISEGVLLALVSQLWPTAVGITGRSEFFDYVSLLAQNYDEYNKLEDVEKRDIKRVLKAINQQKALRGKVAVAKSLADVAKGVLPQLVLGVLSSAL